ncbi:MAG: hypothetical protein ABIR62_14320 [Dokdonella sp.]|uniref:hypothetical protein n=1 Tax=Dokdonella sp. TaxID=2291710 RepID=UPI003265BC9C
MFRLSSPHRLPTVLACLFGCAFAPLAFAQWIFVGPASDPECDYTTIQAAVDAWAASPSSDAITIVISNMQSYPASAITIPTPVASTQLGLRGDMPGCRLSAPSGHVVLDGAGNSGEPVVAIDGAVAGDDHRFEITLGPALEITGGHVAGNGGGLRLRGNAVASLFETIVHDNSAANGGGVSVETTAAGAPHLIMVGNDHAATIRDNAATQDGGGLYCSDATTYCDRYCLIAGNTAGRNGGGVAQQSCETAIYPTKSSGGNDFNVGLRGNSAVGDGGGAWASGGYFAVGGSPPLKPAPVVGNNAGGNGGGLYFTNAGAFSNTQNGVQFDDNQADGDGGALFADSGFLQLGAGFGWTGCTVFDGCPRFLRNHAGGSGGAIALSGSAQGQVSDTMFTDNDAMRASVLQTSVAGAGLSLTNAQIAGNHGAPELLRSSGGTIDLRYVTIADNGGDNDTLIRFDAPGSFGATNSILYDLEGAASGVVVIAPTGTTLYVNCTLVGNDTGLAGEAGVTNLVVADPQWDTSGLYPVGLYVPGPDSPAVDACGPGPGTITDFLGTARPQDVAKPDAAGMYDMGAVERLPDHLFGDGFEEP